MGGLSYNQRLEKLNLPTLQYRRRRDQLIQFYKLLHGHYEADSTKVFQKDEFGVTRGHSWKGFQSIRTHVKSYHANSYPSQLVSITNSYLCHVVPNTKSYQSHLVPTTVSYNEKDFWINFGTYYTHNYVTYQLSVLCILRERLSVKLFSVIGNVY